MSRSFALATLIALVLAMPTRSAQSKESGQEVEQLFKKMAAVSATTCGNSAEDPPDEDKIESAILQAAEDQALENLNARAAKPEQAKAIITQKLEPFERMSKETEAAWPKENRWHFEVIEMLPAILVQFTYRTQGHFLALGIVQSTEKDKPPQWQNLGEDHWDDYSSRSWSQLELSRLHRGPSGAVRFLVSMAGGGCAGSWGRKYGVEEWNPKSDFLLSEAISQIGAEGMDSEPEQPPTKKVPFPTVGVLRTKGMQITLPYCQFTQLDTWDNPSLCMVDTYDLSGDSVVFVSRRYNRPDLAPVAKALEYAKTHDLPALRGYCASEAVARKILRELPGGYGFDAELETVPMGAGREGVRSAYSGVPGFVVEKHGDRWIVVSFDAGQK